MGVALAHRTIQRSRGKITLKFYPALLINSVTYV